jgi:hypothetical protein
MQTIEVLDKTRQGNTLRKEKGLRGNFLPDPAGEHQKSRSIKNKVRPFCNRKHRTLFIIGAQIPLVIKASIIVCCGVNHD